MTNETFKALQITENAEEKTFSRSVIERQISDLPENEVLIRVHYSSLNYKDALSASGNKGVTRNFPHTPGVDAAGVVVEAAVDGFAQGDEVVVIGYDLGMNTPGGYGQYIRVPSKWVVALPDGLSLRESMILGTAGFTAAMSVDALQKHGVTPSDGEILVTGATGGVGSVAVGLLAKLGYAVVAVTGKEDKHEWLKELGASEIIGRTEATDDSRRPMLRTRWAGVVDTVGGDILATALKVTKYGGTVTCCGLVASPKLATTVFPFILRGITLCGIDSVECDISVRHHIWPKLAGEWKLDNLEELATERTLEEMSDEIDKILQGGQTGRILVNLM